MKKFKSIFSFILAAPILLASLSAYAFPYTYLKVTTKNQIKISGEKIGTYQQRWFWEPADATKTYTSIFYFENLRPQIAFVKNTEILEGASTLSDSSLYNVFLKGKNLLLERPPLEGWNFVSTGNDGHHLLENMYGTFAWDISKVNRGLRFLNDGFSNKDYFAWNESVFAPLSGTVVKIRRESDDQDPDPTNSSDLSQNGDGNFVLIHLYDRFYFILMHFKKNSIPTHFRPGLQIETGDFLGRIGNSGVSYSPHLHMTMYYWSFELNRMVSAPTVFKAFEKKTPFGSEVLSKNHAVPQTGEQIRAVP